MICSPERRFGHRPRSKAAVILVGIGVIAGCVRVQPATAPEPPERSAPFDVQGHRGARGLCPENSIPAFRKAIELRVTTLELDLHVTSDRALIVEHDPRPSRARCVMDDGGEVPTAWFKDLSFADVERMDCGRLPDPRFPSREIRPGTRIPRFEQVLALAREAPYPVRINAEIKRENERSSIPVREFVELVVAAIRRHGMEARTSVQSFSPEALVAVRELAPELTRVALARNRDQFDSMLAATGAQVLAPYYVDLRAEDVPALHARGIRVLPWTVNEVDEIELLLDWGVDGIISDYPDRVLAAIGRRKRL